VQSNHLHLIVEAADERALSRAMQGLAVRIARRLNGRTGQRGQVFPERYHAHALKTPREVRNALVYVLHNNRRHHTGRGRPVCPDPFSSASYFDGFATSSGRPFTPALRAPDIRAPDIPPPDIPVSRPKTWLLRIGWKRYGLLTTRDTPA
jgi:hypothetical protein